jgi:polar amino acid transport system substrate-binding protein
MRFMTLRWAVAVVGLSVLAAAPAKAETTLSKAVENGYIRVGFPNQVPYAYANDKGQLTGVDAEVARRVIEKMGIKQMDGVLTEFASLIPGLKAGRFDVVLAMFVNPQRCAEVAFSEPVYSVGQGLIVAAGNPKKIANYDSITSGQSRVAVMAGAVQASYLKKLGVSDDRVQSYPDVASSIAAISTGRADVFAISALSARRLLEAQKNDKVELMEGFADPMIDGKPARGFDAFAMRKADTELQIAFNKALAEVMAQPDYVDVIKPFGLTKADIPTKTTAELCK